MATIKEQPKASDHKEPDFQGEKMKMPEKNFGNTTIVERDSHSGRPSMGPFILILTLILLIVLVGLYFWSQTFLADEEIAQPTSQVVRPTAEENNEPESTTAEAQSTSLQVVSTSNEITAIEADLESTDLENLDAELQAIELEIEKTVE